MGIKRHKPEEIIPKLRQVKVLGEPVLRRYLVPFYFAIDSNVVTFNIDQSRGADHQHDGA